MLSPSARLQKRKLQFGRGKGLTAEWWGVVFELLGSARNFRSGPGKPNQRKVNSWTFHWGIPEQKFAMWIFFFKERNTRIHIKMGEIHELFVLALSLVWFAGATPDILFFFQKLRVITLSLRGLAQWELVLKAQEEEGKNNKATRACDWN